MNCPICNRPVSEPTPGQPLGTFPFCSERCKLVDLGRWLGGKYQVPVAEPDESDDHDSSRTRRRENEEL